MLYRNAPIHPFLRLIYAWLRFTAWAGIRVFYRHRLILGREYTRFDGPAIIVSNHPSTLMDPLNVGLQIRQEMFFLANYSLFKHPLSNWILTRLFCIPVKRKEDVREGEERNNDAAFEASFQHLEKNGVLYIAAEGVSWMSRFVRPFKTGTARIAFGTERRNAWQLGVKIIPVGVSYNAANLFRSNVTIEYGAPIDPSVWVKADQQNHEKAVSDFTTEIEARVRALTLDAGSEAGEVFLQQMEELLRHSNIPGLHSAPREQYFFLKDFLNKNIENEPFKALVDDYFTKIKQEQLTDYGLSMRSNYATILRPIVLLLLFPFFLLGYGFWFLPCWLPWLLCKRLKLYIGYESNVKVLSGLFTFLLALWGGWVLVFKLLGNSWLAWGALVFLIACGLLAEIFMDEFKEWREASAARSFAQKNPATWDTFQAQRQQILNEIASNLPV
jgi:1-acyl-sn-glycerol-3-phosphate acyltransferase